MLFRSDNDGVHPSYKKGHPSGAKKTIAHCCANLIAPCKCNIKPISNWLAGDVQKGTRGIYDQRSRLVHGSTFEQEEFLAQPQNPQDHKEAGELCEILRINSSDVWEGPDVDFAVLHNLARKSLLYFIGRAASFLTHGKPSKIVSELRANDGNGTSDMDHRKELFKNLTVLQLKDKKQFLQELQDSFQNEPCRLELQNLCGSLEKMTV